MLFMSRHFALPQLALLTLTICALAWPLSADAAKPTVKEALGLKPVQKDVDYDIPEPAEIEKCTIDAETIGGITGWVVRTADSQLLRRFLDTNGDNKVDQWCYFKDGIEIYRDIDANFNNKTDQYRWLGTGGTRWGLDDDENNKIDTWKVISAEEVTAEVVAALRDRDAARFQRLLAHHRRTQNARPQQQAIHRTDRKDRRCHQVIHRDRSAAARSSRPIPNGSISVRTSRASSPPAPKVRRRT